MDIKQGNLVNLKTEIADEANRYRRRCATICLRCGRISLLSDDLINLSGDNGKLHLNTKNADIANVSYHFVDRQGKESRTVRITRKYRLMKNASFTSYLQSDDAWQIEAG